VRRKPCVVSREPQKEHPAVRFLSYQSGSRTGVAVSIGGRLTGCLEHDAGYPGSMLSLLRDGPDALAAAHARLAAAPAIDVDAVTVLPPVIGSSKILCVGQNYRQHALEMGQAIPDYPLIFARFQSTLVGHGGTLVRPSVSNELDYEAELAVIIGRRVRHASKASALEAVAGYSIFNDASVRNYQTKSSQFTMGKNFDSTGGFGPVLVTPEELPAGAAGIRMELRLNGAVMQQTLTDDMIFDVPTLIAILSEVMTLEPGDVIITGTPSGVGTARKPQVFLEPGDVCEVDIEGIGVLRNSVVQEAP
jgi:2-keto-4-pentenoate hydratase/2-oxohepta-3-ene-1,7-dioic acid hydratase in catechol pathway